MSDKACKLIFSDGRADKMISEEQYQTLNAFLKSRDQFIEISFDNGETEDMIKRTDIKGTKKMSGYYSKSLQNKPHYICGYGKKHSTDSRCDCYTKLGCTEFQMLRYIQEIVPNFDGSGLTKGMVAHVLERVRQEKQKQLSSETPRSIEESKRLEERMRNSKYGATMVNGFHPYILDTEPNTKILVDRAPEKVYYCITCKLETPPLAADNWDWFLGAGNHTVVIVPQRCNSCRSKVKA